LDNGNFDIVFGILRLLSGVIVVVVVVVVVVAMLRKIIISVKKVCIFLRAQKGMDI